MSDIPTPQQLIARKNKKQVRQVTKLLTDCLISLLDERYHKGIKVKTTLKEIRNRTGITFKQTSIVSLVNKFYKKGWQIEFGSRQDEPLDTEIFISAK
jgi:hypothetical protein